MKHAIPLLALVATVATACVNPDAGFPNQACREAMYRDQTVRDKLEATTGPLAGPGTYTAANQAKQDYYDRCMNAGKPNAGGGVQKVKK